ncbi:endonuclease/exonuclease/phosphatase family metal-dependent hydrolase [Kribbella sp. VKM Ac-2527]|uniref:Endonuclease/exonuclease/phosphatase family metal-dependent hydrolase n=1 Tax=Kribbella caucasensis TaxID=2512215 RepID=A0A4R6KKF6_9ACTN|nr:endonuclease/exonuclease/phosphatase family protein [Kribbella sp. VKM Ac-2527]TDO51643.1 endonuclease/exonuclease/phosphatase family metal-dependent hydrolase [Kribbella sp. VKM Ac-2527]
MTLSSERALKLRILTLNVGGFDGAPERQALLRKGIADIAPDLVALQNVARTEERDQLSELLGDTPLYGTHQLDVLQASSVGTALASRWQPTDVTGIQLPGDENGVANALAADIPLPGGLRLAFLAVKPTWRLDAEAVRCKQARAIADLDARRRQAVPSIIAGDFDATPDADCMRYLTGRAAIDGHSVYYHDAWAIAGDGSPGYTWTSENELATPVIEQVVGQTAHARRIDHVLVGSWHAHPGYAARIRSCRVALTDPPVSQHYGVVVDLEIRPLPSGA